MRLLRHARAGKTTRRGTLLVWAAFASMAIFAACLVSVSVATSTKRVAEAKLGRANAQRLASAAALDATEVLRQTLAQETAVPPNGELTLTSGVGRWTIQAMGGETEAMDASGLSSYDQLFTIESFGTHERYTARERRMVVGKRVPLFQFALVHEHDLTFFNPAPLRINGPVHTNGNLNILTRRDLVFDTNHIRVAGQLRLRAPWDDWYEGSKGWWEDQSVDPDVRRWVKSPFDAGEPSKYESLLTKNSLATIGSKTNSGADSDFVGYDANGDGDFDDLLDLPPYAALALARFGPPDGYKGGTGHTLLSQEHGDNAVLLPPLESFDMYVAGDDYVFDKKTGTYTPVAAGTGTHTKSTFHKDADLSIISKPNGTYVAYDREGKDVTGKVKSAVVSSTLYDARQAGGSGTAVQNTKIDLTKLKDSGYFPKNGLLYVAGEGAGTGTDVKGFQLTAGAELAGPLTVVSPDTVYIHGDFNTKSKKPAAVMADAVGLLSNAWDGKKKAGKLPLAKDTTYNVALVLGDSEPGPGNMNGGAVNLARYHEDWRGETARIVGSIVCPGWSRKATGKFVLGSDHYHAPNREWVFDQDFTKSAQLPPYTPSYVLLAEAAVW
ncbi:MAG: hypothetical protein GC161_01710 [Planctomycetaceae bacterium]|nr:hypothetical protein [Planctomycetaceae bacterium]